MAQACPNCGCPLNASAYPQSPNTKPALPMAIPVGLILSVLSFFIDLFVEDTNAQVQRIPKEMQLTIAVIGLVMAILSIIFLVLIFKGYATGAILYLILDILGYILFYELFQIGFSDVISMLSTISFILPSSWNYYSACAQYRAK